MGYLRTRKISSITKNFYRNADGILFILDATNEENFNQLKDWLSEVCDNNFKKLIVGNKIDLTEKRVVNKEKMENFAKKWN